MLSTDSRLSMSDRMTVNLPEMNIDGIQVDRFVVRDHESILMAIQYDGRRTSPGEYTRLTVDGRLWMSDTDAEKRDHLEPLFEIERRHAKRVLINGLGLGMVVKAALSFDHVEHVDVVELDSRVAEHIGVHYTQDPRVHVHVADAYEQARRWPAGTTWDVAWSDIWPDLCTDNLDGMAQLRRSYGRRTGWHDCWGRELLLRQRREEKRYHW